MQGTEKRALRERATFVVDIRFMQHGSWQGTVKWTEKKKTYTFRSALELIKLIDDISAQGYEVEIPGREESAI